MKFIGIDPGLHGAIAIYDPREKSLDVFDMPIRRVRIKRGKRHVLDHVKLAQLFTGTAITDQVCIEHVHAMPRQGVVSAFRFGEVYGALIQVTACCFTTPIQFAPPQVWKKNFGLIAPRLAGELPAAYKKRVKAASVAKARELFPEYASVLNSDGRAEAALIAVYASYHTGGVL
jgi:crossover junction endodeoxyribonuclease RuvC